MKKWTIILLVFLTAIMTAKPVSYQDAEWHEKEIKIVNGYKVVNGERPVIELSMVHDDAFEKGRIWVKLAPGMEEFIKDNAILSKSEGNALQTGVTSIDILNQKYNVYKIKPILYNYYQTSDHVLKFRDRHKAWGFHLWMEVYLPEGTDVISAVTDYKDLNEIEFAEPVYKTKLHDENNIEKMSIYNKDNIVKWTPNDLFFDYQWHLNNTGQNGGTAGCDINAIEAWNIEKGNENVIVAIHGTGIKLDHEDLAGHINDIVGYNFVDDSNTIVPGQHETACAGIITGVSNNSIGISGIAGGSGTGDGVQLISIQTFNPDGSSTSSNLEYIYSADNGAMISQNSWNYVEFDVYDQLVLDGIDYFNENAGGNIMDGGLVVFSAGNDNSSGLKFPACYSGVLSVAGVEDDDKKELLSNYDTWIDVSAPGNNIFSTTFSPVEGSDELIDSYNYHGGTSFAAPIVSGIAALIISYAPGVFTNQEVWEIIKNTTDNIDEANPSYLGKLGTGRVNAFNALTEVQNLMSEKILSISPYLDYNTYEPSSLANLTVNLKDQENNIVQGASVTMKVEGGSMLSMTEVTPGTYRRQFTTPSSTGIYNISITATKSGYEVGTSSIDLNVQTAGVPGHDLYVYDPNVNGGGIGDLVTVGVTVKNIGLYAESNVNVSFELYDPSNNLLDTDSYTITSINPNYLVPILDITMQTGSATAEGYYIIKVNVNLSNDYDQSNNSLETSVWIGETPDYDVYKGKQLQFDKEFGPTLLTYDVYKIDVKGVSTNNLTARVDVYRNTSLLASDAMLDQNVPEFFDAGDKLMLVYAAGQGGTLYWGGIEVQVGIIDNNNFITPALMTIDLGKTATYKVYTTDTYTTDPSITFMNWDDNGSVVDGWSWNDTNYSTDDTDYDFIITPPTSASISTYRFWVQFANDGLGYYQKLRLNIHAPHNVEVTNVLTPTEIHLGETLDTRGIIKNSGGYVESSIQVQCKLTDNASNEIIANQMNSLAINTVDTMDFSMNVTNIPPGNYSLVVTANINDDLFPANNTMTKPVTVLPMKELITAPFIKEQDLCIGQFLEIEHEVRDVNSILVENAQVYAKLQQNSTQLDVFTCEYDSTISKYVASRRLLNSGGIDLIVTSTYEGYAVSSDTVSFYSMSIPYNLSATVLEDDITLNWEFNEVTKKVHDGYKIYKNYEWLTDINNPAQYQYIDQNLSYGKYVYQVSAIFSDSLSESVISDSLIVRIDGHLVVNSLQPEPGTIAIDETDSIKFAIDSYDPDGNLLEYRWKLDGITIGYNSELTLHSDYNSNLGTISAGEYVLTLDITDNFQSKNSLNYSWNISVSDVNRAPEIITYLPAETNIQVDGSNPSLDFEIAVTDPDIDNTLNYKWLINSLDQNVNDSIFNRTFTSEGAFEVKAIVTDGIASDSTLWNVTSLVGIEELTLPTVTVLHQNYPNPFNPETMVGFDIAQAGQVNVSVYNYKGELVTTLVNEPKNRGSYSIKWNCSNQNGQTVTSGIYFIVMKADNYSKVVKALMVK